MSNHSLSALRPALHEKLAARKKKEMLATVRGYKDGGPPEARVTWPKKSKGVPSAGGPSVPSPAPEPPAVPKASPTSAPVSSAVPEAPSAVPKATPPGAPAGPKGEGIFRRMRLAKGLGAAAGTAAVGAGLYALLKKREPREKTATARACRRLAEQFLPSEF